MTDKHQVVRNIHAFVKAYLGSETGQYLLRKDKQMALAFKDAV